MAADAASTSPLDTSLRNDDELASLDKPRSARASTVDGATQTDLADQAHALFKKIFDPQGTAWLDPRERPSMLSAMASVSLEMKGFRDTTVMLYQARADSSLPACGEAPKARLLHVIHDGAQNVVMATTSEAVGVGGRPQPVGFRSLNATGATEALRRALTPSRDWPAVPVDEFRRSLRNAMQHLVEADPEKLLRLAQAGIRLS